LHGDMLLANPPAGFKQSDVSAAIQIAIWSVENGNAFNYNLVNPAVAALTSEYIADAANAWKPDFNVRAFSDPEGQNDNQTMAMIIPEPPSWMMMLIGFVGIGYLMATRSSSWAVPIGS
jgi:hypothetical protein